jgi:virginiamycin B lyase
VNTFAIPGVSDEEAGGLVEGSDGNLWSTLPGQGIVARTTPAGQVTRFAVGGRPTAIAAGPDGNLWVTDRRAIVRMAPAGTSTRFPNDLIAGAEDIEAGGDGNLWFTSVATGRIGRITPTGVIRLFAHPSAASATALTVAASGEVWYVSPSLDLVARVRADGTIRTFGGSGVSAPGLLTAGPSGDLWFGAGSTAVGAVTSTGEVTVHDSPADLSAPQHLLAGPDGNIWFTAPRVELDDPIGRVTPDGDIRTFDEAAVCRTAEPCSHIWGGVDLTLGPDGNLWFVDTEGQIVRATTDGDLSVWAAPGYPVGPIAIGADDRLWIGGGVGGRTGGRIFRLDPRSGRLHTFRRPGLGGETHDLVAGPDGRVWFLTGRDRIGRIGVDGTVRTFAWPTIHDIDDLAVGPNGALWFSSHRRINRLRTSGAITTFSHTAVGRAVALTAGPDGNLWFVTPAASRIGRITPEGRFSLVRSPDVVVGERGVDALADSDGLWLTSTGNDRVAHVSTHGTITTAAVGPLSDGLALGEDGDLWVGVVGGVARVDEG